MLDRYRAPRRAVVVPERDPNGPVVLTNLLRLQSNPFLEMWWDATRAAGARVERLGWRALRRCAVGDGRFWIHLHFPERYATDRRLPRALLQVLHLIAQLALTRWMGGGVITTIHNARSHEARRPFLEAIVWSAVVRATTDVHLLSAAGASEVLADHPRLRDARRHVIPHGHYRPVLGELADRSAAESRCTSVVARTTALQTIASRRGRRASCERALWIVVMTPPPIHRVSASCAMRWSTRSSARGRRRSVA